MKQGRHPLVLGLLASFGALATRLIGAGVPVLAVDAKFDRLLAAGRTISYPGYGSRGTAAAKRAARKRRNVIRNRRAHRG